MIKLGGSTELYKNPAPANGKEDLDPTKKAVNADGKSAGQSSSSEGDKELLAKQALEQAEKVETVRLENLQANIKKAIDEEGTLKPFKDQILMDQTPEGLRIQIIDKENRSMFDIGSASLKDYSIAVLLELSKAIQKVPNRISISGHTDTKKYYRQNYGNWELSTDRANAARRALIAGGLPEDKIGRVVGLASTALLDPTHEANPVNRRISIIVMNARTEQAIQQESNSLLSVQPEGKPLPADATAAANVSVAP
jgi:chemotaxis protein MotB